MSEKITLAIIENAGGWLVTLVALIGAVTGAITGIWGMVKSNKATKEVAAQKVEVDAQRAVATKQSSTICDLKDEACRAQALAIHATQEMAETREEARKLYDFVETNVFMAKATAPTDSGRPGLTPLTDSDAMRLEDSK